MDDYHYFNLLLTCFNFVLHSIRYACRSDEEEEQVSEPPNPVAPTKLPRNDGAGHYNSDAETPITQYDKEDEERPKQKRKRACV